ncbi:glycosyltransferase [Citrobacter sedlakii]|uniref:glycosyltransferase n=1 Tax=Citrobacter sedlakii TaxID=67826 RepID=UPI003B2591B9
MKNIAFMITKAEIGGAQTWVNELAKLVKDDCKIFLITSDEGWLTQSDNFSEILLLPGMKNVFHLGTYVKLVRFIRKKKINTIIASSANAGIYARISKLFCDFRCIYVSHGWSCLYNGGKLKRLFCEIEKYLSILTDIVWCVSESDKKKAIEIIGIKDDKIVTITNAVPPMPTDFYKISKKKILFVGRLTHPKRPELLVQVIAKNPEYKLTVVGGGEFLEALKSKYSKFDNIEFIGEVKNFIGYNKFDIFALISDSEGLPMSALEAHTAGIPLLLSNVGGCYELIEKNGLLVENNEVDIERKLKELFANYDCFRNNAIASSGQFNINNYASLYKKIILK